MDKPIMEPDNGMKNLIDYDVNESKLLVWLPEDYQSTQDVVIESADTTMISISKSFYERMEEKVEVESILNIILTDEEMPFIRKVSAVSAQADRYFLTTEQASIEEMFRNLDLEVSSEPYYSAANSTRFGDSKAAFVDEGGVVHPAKYVIEHPDGTKEVIDMHQYMASRASMDLNFNWNPESHIEIPFDCLKLEIDLKSKLSAYARVEINISWFKLQKFEAKIGGSVDLNVPVSLGVEAELFKKRELDKDLLKGPRINAMVWIGPVPISIGITPSLNLTAEFGVTGQAKANFGFDYNMSFQTGVRYERNRGWGPLNSFNQKLTAHDFIVSAGLQANAEVGLYAKLGLDIYGLEAVYAKVGAYIEGNAGAQVSNQSITVNYNCQWGVDARLGAKVKIVKWTLAEWETRIPIFGPYTILDYEKTYP
ncbi:hypothetical protein [uncultured Alistipes sp.]|uniref:hypothetical protein n=1 Tax=uncultured Alistipes sp. TaxID=538949 RepID=UPI0025E013C7|nr:hypothetical protein [uncultured Alistipes sp.]